MPRKKPTAPILIGTAGWSVPRDVQSEFAATGSHLVRYASRFSAAEINTSFYRPHRPATYARWQAAVPESFRFSVKLPKTITHEQRLVDVKALVDAFLEEVSGLGEKFGCLLVQLPPSLVLEARVANTFFKMLRSRTTVAIVCEPRHETWFTAAAEKLLQRHQIARVAADPAKVAAAAQPGGWGEVIYYRLHGSPRIYYSEYADEYLDRLATQLKEHANTARAVWCIFDNTASGAAASDALKLLHSVDQPR